MAYNIGIRYASKEVVMLQNAEVCHVGDILSFTANTIKPSDWLTFNCYGLNKETTNKVYAGDSLSYEFIKALPQTVGGNSVASKDLEAYGIYRGNPAEKVKDRTISV